MKVELLKRVGPHEAGTIVEVNDNMFIHLTGNGLAKGIITDKTGHKFIKNTGGDLIDITTIEDLKAIEKTPENKAIFTVPKNKAITKAPKNK